MVYRQGTSRRWKPEKKVEGKRGGGMLKVLKGNNATH
jgi:hypothetical protein